MSIRVKQHENSNLQRGCNLQRAGNLDEARAEFESACKACPNVAVAHANYAFVLLALNDTTDKALVEARKAIQLHGKNISYRAQLILGAALIDCGMQELAVGAFVCAIAAVPNHSILRALAIVNLANVYVHLKRLEKASHTLHACMLLVQSIPSSSSPATMCAVKSFMCRTHASYYEQMKLPYKVLVCVDEALQLDGDGAGAAQAWLLRARAQRDIGWLHEAQISTHTSLKLQPANAVGHRLVAELLSQLGMKGSKVAMDVAVALAPNNAAVLVSQGMHVASCGHMTLAADTMTRAAALAKSSRLRMFASRQARIYRLQCESEEKTMYKTV